MESSFPFSFVFSAGLSLVSSPSWAVPPATPAPASTTGTGPATDPPPPKPRAYGGNGDEEINFPVSTKRRGGVQLEILLGPQLLEASGTPTDFSKRNDTYRVNTGLRLGATTSFFVGGALTDWFVFHVGFHQSIASKQDLDIAAAGLLAGVEVWPFFSLGGVWRDLGLGADFGTGSATIKNRLTDDKVVNGGAYSHARAVIFWEAARFWKINLGPALGYEALWSQTYTQTAAWLTLRAAFYGMPLWLGPVDRSLGKH